MSARDGIRAAIQAEAERIAEARRARQDKPQQLPLLGAEDPAPAADGEAGEARRGPGRPAGSLNKRTEAMRAYLAARYGDPLEVLAQIASKPLLGLAAELGFDDPEPGTLLELLRVQIAAARELAPFVHSKRPVAIEAKSQGFLAVGIFTGQAGGKGGETDALDPFEALDRIARESVENQQVIEHEPAELDGAELDKSDKGEQSQ